MLGRGIDYYIDESLPNAAHLEQAAKAHIGEHGSVHVVSMEQLGETPCKNESAEEDSSRVVITDKVITEYVHQLILRPHCVYDGYWLASKAHQRDDP